MKNEKHKSLISLLILHVNAKKRFLKPHQEEQQVLM